MEDIKTRPTTHTNNGGEEQPVDLETQRFGSQYKSKEEVEKLEGRSLTDTEYEELKKKYPHTSKPEETTLPPKPDLTSLMDKSTKEGILKFLAQKQVAKYSISLKNLEGTREQRVRNSERSKMSPETKAECNKIFKRALQNSTFSMRVKAVGICELLEDNKFKNQIELHNQGKEYRTGGYFKPTARARVSQSMFGTLLGTSPYDEKNLKAFNDAEKYGFLGSKNNKKNLEDGADWQYGPFVFNFKPSIRNRVTYTVGDSLGDSASPQLVDKEYDEYCCTNERFTERILRLRDKENIDMIDVCNAAGASYVEAQYHGLITLDDVESLIIPRSQIMSGKFDEMYQIYKRKGYTFKLLVQNEMGEIVDFVERA